MKSSILKSLISACLRPDFPFYFEIGLVAVAITTSFCVFLIFKKVHLNFSKYPIISKAFCKQSYYLSSLLICLLVCNLGYRLEFENDSPLLLFFTSIASYVLLLSISKKIFPKKIYALSLLILSLVWLSVVSGYYKTLIEFLNHFDLRIGVVKTSLLKLIQSAILISILTWFATFLSNKFEAKINDNKQLNKSTKLLVSKIFRVSCITLAVFLAMSSVGIDLSIITFFAGAIGVAIGFGLQNIVSNIFCGFIILFDKSIRPGDVVALEDIETYGIVHKLNARFISIRTREGIEHLIPNEVFISKKTENWTHSDPFIRVSVSFFVSIHSDLDLVEKILLTIADKAERTVKDRTPHVRVYSITSYSVEMRLRVWIADPENGFSSLKSFIYKEALSAFRENNIVMPHPPMTIYHNQPTSPYYQKEMSPV